MSLTTQWTEIRQLTAREQSAAWQAFVDRYRDFVLAALRRLIWSHGNAEQASEEFWSYLFESGVLMRLQPPMRFRAFLTGTLRNYAHGWQRRNHATAMPDAHDELEAPVAAMPEDEELRLWGRQLLHLAMQRLERTQPRWSTALRRFYGLPAHALAEASERTGATALAAELDVSPNALHQLLFRARQGLRESMIEEVRLTVSTRPELAAEFDLVFAALGTTNPGLLAHDPS